MKVIFSIAKNEFRNLFYSPIAWFVLLLFFMNCAHAYTNLIHYLANYQEVELKNNPSFKEVRTVAGLTYDIFINGGFFGAVAGKLFLIIPLLTMGLISRDYNSGTSALLYSSPISIRKVVLGKYLGIMSYNILLVLIVAIFLAVGIANIRQADFGMLASALLGFYLMTCAYSAIGLFLSSLSKSQIVSAIATMLALFAVFKIGDLWQEYDFVRDLTYWLSLPGRADKLLLGLIVTRDLVYFILVPGMFIAFTCYRLSDQLQFRPLYIKTARFLLTLAVVLLTGYIFSRPALTGYLDTTATKRMTLHPRTQQVLKELGDSTLEVTLYTNLFAPQKNHTFGLPENRNKEYLSQFWDRYLRFKPDIRFKYVYYYAYDTVSDPRMFKRMFPGKSLQQVVDENVRITGKSSSMYVPLSQVQSGIDLRGETEQLVMQLKYNGRSTILRTAEDKLFWPDETNMIASLKRLQGVQMPSIAFSTGSLEREIYKYGEREFAINVTLKQNRHSLINIGFDIDTINLNTQSIPDQLTALVIADPKMDISAAAQEKVNSYIDKGGNLLINGEPGKQYVLNPLLARLGRQLAPGQLVYPTYDETPEKVYAELSASGKKLAESIYPINTHLLMPGVTAVSSLENTGWKTDSITNTIPGESWLKSGDLVIDSTLPAFNAAAGDIKQNSFSTFTTLTRSFNGKEQRIAVSGDADFASNKRAQINTGFFINLSSWMVNNQFPVVAQTERPKDVLLSIGEKAAKYQKTILFWVVPGILLIAGVILLVRRKRK